MDLDGFFRICFIIGFFLEGNGKDRLVCSFVVFWSLVFMVSGVRERLEARWG